MNRRTFLKGAAATAAVGAIGARRPGKSFAAGGSGARRLTPAHVQLPYQYELISIYQSNEFVYVDGRNWRGTARDINNAGTIIGDTALDGVMVATTWDASLNMSVLDAGPYTGLHINLHLLDDTGTMLGYGIGTDQFVTEEQSQGQKFSMPTII